MWALWVEEGCVTRCLESRAATAKVILDFVFLGASARREKKKKELNIKNEKYFSEKIYSSLKGKKCTLGNMIF